ncbi:molybdopterin-dependent oxidoreductase [Acidobacteriota bacterium]
MKVILDGKVIEAERQQTILDVARENGIYIPSLCDHAELSPFTGCRLCLVEIDGRRGYAPSCGTQVEDGIEVKTDTPQLRKLRGQILELILSEHPNACLICSEKESCDDYKSTIRKVGEVTGCVLCSNNKRCELQDVVDALKIDKVSFPSVYRDIEVKKNDPFFDRNYNLCILCGRCVRVCHELRGASAISFVHRGSEEVIGTVLDKPLLETGCQFCGACVDVCPTGALTERALKYEPLADAQAQTVCPLCSMGCKLDVWLHKGRILSTSPSAEDVVNRGQGCLKGRFLVKDVVASEQRILKPMIKRKKEFEEVTWAEALDFVAGKLKMFKPKETAVVESAQASCEDSYLLRKFASDVLKTENISSKPILSAVTEFLAAAQKSNSTPKMNFNMRDIYQAETIFVMGSDIVISHPIIWLQVLKAVRNGARLIVASPTPYLLERYASHWIQVNPGTDSVLLGYLAKLLLKTQETQGILQSGEIEKYKNQLQKLSISELKNLTAVDKELLEEVVEVLADKAPAVFLAGGSIGSEGFAALWNLALLSQATVLPLSLENNQRGLCALDNGSPNKGKNIDQVVQSVLEHEIKALYIVGPVHLPKKGKLEFVVVQSPYMDENAAKADVVLPAATFAETEGTYVNVEGRVQKVQRVIELAEEAKPDWWILTELAKKMKAKGFNYKKSSDILKEIRKVNPLFANATDARLANGAEIILKEDQREELKLASVKFELKNVETSRKFPYVLITDYGLDYYRNLTLSQEVRGLGLIRDSRAVRINPVDAEKLGIIDGDPVQVVSENGKMVGAAKITDAVPLGILKVYYLLSENSAQSAASLLFPLSAEKDMKSVIPVKIKRG